MLLGSFIRPHCWPPSTVCPNVPTASLLLTGSRTPVCPVPPVLLERARPLHLHFSVPGVSALSPFFDKQIYSRRSCSCAQANHMCVQPGLDLIPALARQAGPRVVTHWAGWTCPSSYNAETHTVRARTKPHMCTSTAKPTSQLSQSLAIGSTPWEVIHSFICSLILFTEQLPCAEPLSPPEADV